MRGLLIAAILLAFPVLELFLVGRIAGEVGWQLTLAWLFLSAVSGILLIRGQSRFLLQRIVGVLQRSDSIAGALFAGIRPLLAGLLLIFPGPLTDVLAILLLLIPAPSLRPPEAAPRKDTHWDGTSRDGVIEGEWRREESGFSYTEAIAQEKNHDQEIPAPDPENKPDPGSRQTDRGSGPG